MPTWRSRCTLHNPKIPYPDPENLSLASSPTLTWRSGCAFQALEPPHISSHLSQAARAFTLLLSSAWAAVSCHLERTLSYGQQCMLLL